MMFSKLFLSYALSLVEDIGTQLKKYKYMNEYAFPKTTAFLNRQFLGFRIIFFLPIFV